MIGRIFTVGGLTLLSRLTGFLRDMVLAAVLGAGPIADAFFVALRLPNHFRSIFAEGAFNAAFIPAYARIRTAGGPEPARLFADHVFTLLLASQVVLLALALLFTPALVSLLAPGLAKDPVRYAYAVELTRITFPYLLLVTLVTLYGGILNALHRFAAAAAAPILLNLAMIDDARVRVSVPERRARGGLGRTDRGRAGTAPGRRRCIACACARAVLLADAGTRISGASSGRSGRRRSARPACRSRCSPTPSSRASSPPARSRRSIMPTGSPTPDRRDRHRRRHRAAPGNDAPHRRRTTRAALATPRTARSS